MKIKLKRKITLILFVILVGSLLFFNHSFYFGTIFISFVVVNEYLYEKFKRKNENNNKTTKKLIKDLECMISGEYKSDEKYKQLEKEIIEDIKNNDENRSEEIC